MSIYASYRLSFRNVLHPFQYLIAVRREFNVKQNIAFGRPSTRTVYI